MNIINVGPRMFEIFTNASYEVKGAKSLFGPLTPMSPVREWDTEQEKELGAKYGGRVGYPEDVAGHVGMFCSPDWVTSSLFIPNSEQWTGSWEG